MGFGKKCGHCFQKGDKIRLSISSSMSPVMCLLVLEGNLKLRTVLRAGYSSAKRPRKSTKAGHFLHNNLKNSLVKIR